MISNSIWVMTAIDLVMVALVAYALGCFAVSGRHLKLSSARLGFAAIIAGLSLFALFYFVDLLLMHLVPLIKPWSVAMGLMRILHGDYGWVVAVVGVGAISIGVALSARGLTVLVGELESSRDRLADSQRMANVGSYHYDLVKDELSWSDELYRMFGVTLGEINLNYDAFLKMIHPDDRSHFKERVASTWREKGHHDFEYRIVRADGGIRHVFNRAEVVLDRLGEPVVRRGVIQDITERKRGEDAIHKLGREKALILNAAGEGIYGLDLEGQTTFANPAAARMIGWKPEELIGKPQHDLLHHTKPDGSPYPREECPIYASFRDGKVHQVSDEVFWRKDGTSFPVEYVSTPIREDGKIIGAVVVFSDITVRKLVEEKLWESNTRLQAILDHSPAKIHIKDAEGRYTLINKRSEDLFGVTDEEARGRTSRELFPEAVANAFMDHDRKVLDHGEPVEEEEEWHLEDGVHTYLTVKFPIHDASGKVSAVGAIGTDITERKHEQQNRQKAEDRLHDAIESVADGFVLFDADDRVVMWNQRFADMYPELAAMLPNKPTAEDMFRERYRVGAVGDFHVSAEEYVSWRIEMRRKQGGTPAVHRHSDGRWFRTTERRTTEGGVVAISTDVTELKNSEMDQRDAKRQAQLANRSKSEFLANMSHELRTPLNAVIGFSEIIMGGMLGPVGNAKYIEYAKDINASGQHLLAIINDILDLSKIEAGKLELYEQVVDVTKVLNASMTLVKERAEEAALSLEKHVSDGLPTIIADQIKLKQALINLLSNAVKFTGPGGTVSVHAFVEPNGDLAIQVADTGVGIAPEDIPKVMEPFGQVDNSLARRHQGTGLGLPLSKALIELHEGTLVLESELGVGTTVTIRLPAERVRDRAA